MKLKFDWWLIFFSVTASMIGILALLGGSEVGSFYAWRKTIWLILGIILMLSFSFLNYQNLGAYAPIIYSIGILILLFTLVPIIGTKVKGARSWIRIFGLGFQPSEFMKLALVIALAKYLVLRESEIDKLKELIVPILMALLPMALIAIQPDLGSAVLFLGIVFAVLFIGGANTSVILGATIVGLSTAIVPMFLEYQNFILVDEISNLLKKENFKLADALRILGFDVWQYARNPALIPAANSSEAIQWAVSTLRDGNNLELFMQTALKAEDANPNWIRSFFRNNTLIIFLFSTGFILYGCTTFIHYFYKTPTLKNLGKISMIMAISLASSFFFTTFVSFKPHQVVRVVSFANPDKFPKGAGYQLRHSLITIGSGQIVGKGLFEGDMTKGKTPFLPEWYNDFIFSVIGEQFGFIGTIITLLMLFGIILRGISIALNSKDDFGALLGAGITIIFFFHIVINIGIAIGFFPVTGLPLSFVSYGGSNMIMSFIALGILQNIYRRKYINA